MWTDEEDLGESNMSVDITESGIAHHQSGLSPLLEGSDLTNNVVEQTVVQQEAQSGIVHHALGGNNLRVLIIFSSFFNLKILYLTFRLEPKATPKSESWYSSGEAPIYYSYCKGSCWRGRQFSSSRSLS